MFAALSHLPSSGDRGGGIGNGGGVGGAFGSNGAVKQGKQTAAAVTAAAPNKGGST